MNDGHFDFETRSRLENLPIILDFIAEATERLGIDSGTATRIQLVVDEACTNLIKHAYSGQTGPIKLTMEAANGELTITIRDKGRPFDPGSVPSPDLEADLEKRQVGGLGMYLMRQLMDEVSYNFDVKKGNTLTMRKRCCI